MLPEKTVLPLLPIANCMKTSRIAFSVLIIGIIGSGSCLKTGQAPVETLQRDSTITDTTEYIDFMLDGKRVFQICDATAPPDSDWGWFRLSNWGSSILPDTVYYPLSSFKGGLMSNSVTVTPTFYFIRNGYGIDMNDYTASKGWWLPLMQQSFIDSFYQPGNYSFALPLHKDTVFSFTPFSDPVKREFLGSGIQLSWLDENGKLWQTSSGTADQTGSFFTITKNKSTPFTFQPGYADYAESTFVSAVFDCKLYDDKGHSMHVTNGRFSLFVSFNLY